MPSSCMYRNARAESNAICILCAIDRFTIYFFKCRRSNKLPWSTFSKTITILGMVGYTPMSMQMFGCRKMLYIMISF